MGNIEQWIKVIQVLIGTGVLGTATWFVNSDIQDREITIKEMEHLSKYVEMVTEEEVGRRLKLSEFFMSITQSEGAREGWKRYHDLVQQEYDIEEKKKQELAQEKIERDAELEKLSHKLVADAKEIDALKKKLSRASINQKKAFEIALNKKREEAKKVARTLSNTEKSLATIQQQIIATSNKLSFLPQQRILEFNRKGWVYLGDYDGKVWSSKYFDVDDKINPSSLKGKKLTVIVKAVNIRKSMPSTFGNLGPIETAISSGQTVTILDVKPWLKSGYMWAKVRY